MHDVFKKLKSYTKDTPKAMEEFTGRKLSAYGKCFFKEVAKCIEKGGKEPVSI